MSPTHPIRDLILRVQQGDRLASEQLFPLVYQELKQMAEQRMKYEAPSGSMQATALVHEAYLRMIGPHTNAPQWDDLGHFFGAASQAMQRILVDRARKRSSKKRGGNWVRQVIDDGALQGPVTDGVDGDALIALEDAMRELAKRDPTAEELVRLRYFSGLTIPQAAQCLGISVRTANRTWHYARAWLYQRITEEIN